MLRQLTIGILLTCAYASGASAQEAKDAEALAKALSNPVAALISVPMQLNFDTGYSAGGERWTLNVQPVIPIDISENWNLISRTIVPLIDQSDVINNGSQSGLGDIVQSLFFSPKKPTAAGWILGVGPAFLLPTATDDLLGAEQWAIGPTAVALKQTETGWTYGALANYLVSVAGDDDRADVNAMFMQPFVSKSLGGGATVVLNLESTYDFEGEQWNIPANLMYSKVTRMGKQMVSWQGGVRAYLDSPDGGPDWGLRFAFTLLYPR
ncbi:MAG: hypothetical protein R3F24_10185 [Gammaproteobacteria bacterium]